MDETNGATCGSPISMQDVKIEFQKPQFQRAGESEGSVVVVVLCVRWIEEEMRWQVVDVFSA